MSHDFILLNLDFVSNTMHVAGGKLTKAIFFNRVHGNDIMVINKMMSLDY